MRMMKNNNNETVMVIGIDHGKQQKNWIKSLRKECVILERDVRFHRKN